MGRLIVVVEGIKSGPPVPSGGVGVDRWSDVNQSKKVDTNPELGQNRPQSVPQTRIVLGVKCYAWR